MSTMQAILAISHIMLAIAFSIVLCKLSASEDANHRLKAELDRLRQSQLLATSRATIAGVASRTREMLDEAAEGMMLHRVTRIEQVAGHDAGKEVSMSARGDLFEAADMKIALEAMRGQQVRARVFVGGICVKFTGCLKYTDAFYELWDASESGNRIEFDLSDVHCVNRRAGCILLGPGTGKTTMLGEWPEQLEVVDDGT